MGVTRGGSSVGSKLPMVTEGEAVPQEGQEASGRYLRVPEDVLEGFWTSGSSWWLPGTPGLLDMVGLDSAAAA